MSNLKKGGPNFAEQSTYLTFRRGERNGKITVECTGGRILKAMKFKIEDSQVSEEVKKLRIIFTSTAWGQGSDTCPSCNKAPVKLRFTESIKFNGKYVIGQCLLCNQLVAYKGLVHDGKRSRIRNHTRKNIFGGNPIIGKQFETLFRQLVSQMPTNQKHHTKLQMFKKKLPEKKDEQEAQMSFEFCSCNI